MATQEKRPSTLKKNPLLGSPVIESPLKKTASVSNNVFVEQEKDDKSMVHVPESPGKDLDTGVGVSVACVFGPNGSVGSGGAGGFGPAAVPTRPAVSPFGPVGNVPLGGMQTVPFDMSVLMKKIDDVNNNVTQMNTNMNTKFAETQTELKN